MLLKSKIRAFLAIIKSYILCISELHLIYKILNQSHISTYSKYQIHYVLHPSAGMCQPRGKSGITECGVKSHDGCLGLNVTPDSINGLRTA